MPTNRYEICSRASLLVGGKKITGFTGATTEEIVAEALYDSVVDNLLSSYRWRFAASLEELDRLDGTPSAKWAAAYQIPNGVQVIHGVYIDDSTIDFDRIGDVILCNAGLEDNVVGLFGTRPDEELWPAYFVATLELKLAAMFAIPIAEDAQKATTYEGMAMRQFAQARSLESQGRTAAKLPVGGLRHYARGRA